MAMTRKSPKTQKPTFVSHLLTNGDNNSRNNSPKHESCFYVALSSHGEMQLEPNLLPGEIVISQLGKVTRYVPYSNDNTGQIGTLFVTNFKVSYVTLLADSSPVEDEDSGRMNKLIGKDDIALTNIFEIYHTSKGKRRKLEKGNLSPKISLPVQCLELHCKDFRIHNFSFESCDRNEVCKMIHSILHHAFPSKMDLLFVFSFEKDKCFNDIDLSSITNFMCPRDWETELLRFQAHLFRVTSCNVHHTLSENLPEYFVVPMKLEDTAIVSDMAELDRRAIPLWSYSYVNGCALIRLAYGLRAEACVRMLEFVRNSHPNERKPIVIDLGDGRLPFLRDLQSAYEQLREQCMPTTHKDLWSSDLTWYSALENSQWLSFVSRTLFIASDVVRIMSFECRSVVMREKDGGTDFSPVVSCLAQLMMDCESRTITGFQNLIEKEWVVLGHKFADRCGIIYQNDGEESPLFLLFLDCVWQLLQQFPSSFEFSEIYLTSLWDSIGLAMFQNFMFNGPSHRSSTIASLMHRLRNSNGRWNFTNYLMSVWDWQRQFSAGDIALFTNPLYVAHEQIEQWQSRNIEFSEAYGLLTARKNGHKSGSLSPRQPPIDMRKFSRIQSLHGMLPCSQNVLNPGFAAAQIKLWEHCYLRWLTPIQIVGGGMPCEFLAQTILLNEIQTIQEKIAKIEGTKDASVTVNLSKKPRKFVGSVLSVTVRMSDCVSSSYPFSPTRPSNLSIIPVVSPSLQQSSIDDPSVDDQYYV